MAIDQRDVSSTLRFMDDRVLQQYAAMHKNDPYIFPLAFQESQNRQKLRMNQQAQAGMMPQPKVNEQALAQMAPPQAQPMPEDVGIATLPAPNMTMAAEGGIMGYPDDANFAERSEPVVMMAGGGVARYNGAQGSVTASSELASLLAARERYVQAGADTSGIDQAIAFLREKPGRAAAQRAANSAQPAIPGGFAEQMVQDIAPPTPVTAQATMPTPGYTRPGMKDDPRLNTPPTQPVVAAPKPDAERRAKPANEVVQKEPAQATTDVMGMFDQALQKADEKPTPFEARLKEINTEKVKAGEANVAGLEAIQKQFSDIFKGKKERLDTREGEIGKMKDQSLGLALLNAGAAMMSTRGSIGQAIGAGIDTGSKQYVAGLDKINAAKDKLSDARDRLEELEAQRGEMSARELHKARNEVKALTVSGMENLVQAAMAERKLNRTEAVEFVKAQLAVSTADKDRASRENIAAIGERGANARAAMPTGADRTAMMLGTGKTPAERLESGMKKLQEITADKSGMAAVKVLADINAKRQPGEPTVTMQDLLIGAREFSSLMYGPKVADVAPTRARP
jgi:hypothetical protein